MVLFSAAISSMGRSGARRRRPMSSLQPSPPGSPKRGPYMSDEDIHLDDVIEDDMPSRRTNNKRKPSDYVSTLFTTSRSRNNVKRARKSSLETDLMAPETIATEHVPVRSPPSPVLSARSRRSMTSPDVEEKPVSAIDDSTNKQNSRGNAGDLPKTAIKIRCKIETENPCIIPVLAR